MIGYLGGKEFREKKGGKKVEGAVAAIGNRSYIKTTIM